MRGILALLLAWLASAPAFAQVLPPDQSLVNFNRYVSIRERQLSGYATAGIPLASFTLQPAISVNAVYNDNVLALEEDGPADLFVRLSPNLSLNSNWVGSQLSLNAAADVERYVDQTTENTENINVSAYGWHDVTRNTRVRAIGRFQSLRESRDSQDVFVLTRRPIRYRNGTVGLGASHRFANALLQIEGAVSRTDYDDAELRDGGAPIDQDFRDSLLKRARGRLEIGQSPSLAYFVQGTFDKRDFRLRARDPLASARGSQVVEILVGTRFELPILARGEIGVGYTKGTYSSDRLETFSGLAIRSDVTFFPTQLTNVTVTAERRVNDTGVPSAGGYTSLSGGVRVDHELLRPLLLSASARYQRDSFNGIDRDDDRVELAANASYRINDYFSAQASVTRLDLSSRGNEAFKSFVTNRILFGIGLRR